jgi:MerR family transcriptional regulator, mercuric resistance operon regulatory protein
LLPAPPRRGRYRSYGQEDVGRLGFLRRAREPGFTLNEVRALLGLAAGGPASCTEARAIAAAHLQQVRARISDLRRMERVLAETVRACDAGDDVTCPLIAALSRPMAPSTTQVRDNRQTRPAVGGVQRCLEPFHQAGCSPGQRRR